MDRFAYKQIVPILKQLVCSDMHILLANSLIRGSVLFIEPLCKFKAPSCPPKTAHAQELIGSVCTCSPADIKPFSVWWSTNRIDYALETPKCTDSLDLLPPPAFAHIMQSRYWEAKELVSFVLRQVCGALFPKKAMI